MAWGKFSQPWRGKKEEKHHRQGHQELLLLKMCKPFDPEPWHLDICPREVTGQCEKTNTKHLEDISQF
jgi:hypothetical protein